MEHTTENAGTYVDYSVVSEGTNLLQSIGSWTVQWGDELGAVNGVATIENTASGQRLKIEVFSNPNNRPVSVFINANVPQDARRQTGDGKLARGRKRRCAHVDARFRDAVLGAI